MSANVSKLSSFVPEGAPPITVKPAYHTSVGRHSHEFYELVYIRDGFCLHDVDDKMMLLMEGDLFMIKPGQHHRYIGNRVVNIFNCLFAVDQIPQEFALLPVFAPDMGRSHPHIHLELNERKDVVRLLTGMLGELSEKQFGWETKLHSQLISLLVDYARMYARHTVLESDKQTYIGYVTPALLYIDQNYVRDLTVREIAAAVGVSGDYLTRQFKQVIGITPLDYLKRYRFARAMELLQQSVSVTEVAERVGFMSLSHFSREFKKELGITPSQYRNQNQNQ